MGQTSLLIMTVIGPAILLVVLLWILSRSNGTRRTMRRTERATRQLYAEEEKRRRNGTDRS